MPGEGVRLPTVSVVIAAFSMERWNDLRAAVASVLTQTVPVLETIVVIDHHPELLAKARSELPGVTVIPARGGRGASVARNTGVAASHGELVAFLDDDAVASPRCLEAFLCHFTDPNVVGVGGRLSPLWATSRPRWFPPEFDWTVGASYLGMPTSAAPVRNVWSTNMAIRRRAFDLVGGFRDDFGKVGARSRPEDTDLCLRAAGHSPGRNLDLRAGRGGRPSGPGPACHFSLFCLPVLQRGMGQGGAGVPERHGREHCKRAAIYQARAACALAQGLREALSGDASGGLRSLAIVAGFTAVMIGFLAATLARLIPATTVRRTRPARVTMASAVIDAELAAPYPGRPQEDAPLAPSGADGP